MGKGGRCVIKDDFDWLLDKMLDADGIILGSPVFEKGAAGITRNITDRFGPRTDRGMVEIAKMIAENMPGGKLPDERLLKDKAIAFIGLGGSEWTTRVECDHAMLAMSPKWTVIDNLALQWSKAILVEDDRIARVRKLGVDLANAAKDISNAEYVGEKGICSHCHGKEFYIDTNTGMAICCLCGIEGQLDRVGDSYEFSFDEKWLALAHDTMSGKYHHAEDLKGIEGRARQAQQSDIYKERVQKYKEFISASKPN
jgi:multimeric flavodoxin WrbA